MQKHLLLVDSDPESIEALVQTLQPHDFKISVAGDGEQGYALAQSLRPDCIIFDVELEGTSGTIMYSRLRRNPDTKSIPAIVRSAVGPRPVDFGTGIPAISKTCSSAVLLQTISTVMPADGATIPA